MKNTKSGRMVALVAAIAIASVSGLAQAQDKGKDTWTPPKEPDYDWEKWADTVKPPPDGSFPKVSSDLPLNVDGMKPGAPVFLNQQYFDIFSWRTFIALNWPTSPDNYGQPDIKVPIGSAKDQDFDRVWESFIAPEKVFKSNGAKPDSYPTKPEDSSVLTATAKRTHLLNESDEAFFDLEKPLPPIVDTSQEYVRYEIGINKKEYKFICDHKLYNINGQEAYIKTLEEAKPKKELLFPTGSIEIKAGWKKLTAAEVYSKRFYTRKVDVFEPFAPGKPTLKDQIYGLVGFHIMYVATGDFPTKNGVKPLPIHEWVWPTFEHVDNAPLSDLRPDSRKKTTEVSEWEWDRTPGGPVWTPKKLKQAYSFFDPAGKMGADSRITSIGGFSPLSKKYMDQTSTIYSNFSGLGNYFQYKEPHEFKIPPRLPSQIAKVITDNNAIVASQWTYALNEAMQKQLREIDPNNVWANYRLVTTQWATQPGLIEKWKNTHPNSKVKPSATVKAGNPAPVSLGNSVAETYMQINGSCMNCHAGATYGTGPKDKQPDSNFSFMLQRAKYKDTP